MEPDDSSYFQVLFCDLPDPKGRFKTLKENQAHQRYEMCIPPVYTADGKGVVPSKYEDAIPDGTLVAVHGKMKMCVHYLFCFMSLQLIF
jgi:hypothetical protein